MLGSIDYVAGYLLLTACGEELSWTTQGESSRDLQALRLSLPSHAKRRPSWTLREVQCHGRGETFEHPSEMKRTNPKKAKARLTSNGGPKTRDIFSDQENKAPPSVGASVLKEKERKKLTSFM